MALPQFVSDLFAGRSKRFLTALASATALLIIIVFALGRIEPIAQARLQSILKDAGFSNVTIGDVALYPSGLRAQDIKLDAYGFDEIKTLYATISWPTFIGSGKISSLEIKDVSLSRSSENFQSSGRQAVATLLNLPDYRLVISGAAIDLDTGFGIIRVTSDITAEPTEDGENHRIQANINANQYQLGFTSTWQGMLKKDGTFDLAGNVMDGRMNFGPLRVSRFSGWAGASIDQQGHNIQSQLQAGSASFMDVPLQSISLINNSGSGQGDIIIRSGISGMPDILFTADMKRNNAQQEFTAILKGKNLGALLDHIDEVTAREKKIDDALLALRDFELVASFQPEKRFVGGPLPFGLTLQASGKEILNGNMLFYPASFDMRGSLETNPATAMALQNYFKIPSKNISQNFIRLDGDIRKFIGFEHGNETP